ncbi:MAG: hypothetical protein IKB10_00730 [Alphaproteobacteria bacterium]|nr:hypothetical protein [Alphaproteobacteria bacterium]
MYAQKIQDIINKKFIGRKNVTPRSKLKADLWFDDFDINVLLNFLERDLGVKLPERVCDKYTDVSVAQLAAIVENALMKKYTMAPQQRVVKHDCI